MDAQTIILQAFILAMVMQAISAIFSEGMILSAVGAWLEANLHFAWKMTMGCPVCMCPWYGTGILLALNLSPIPSGLSILTAMGINWVLGSLQPIDHGNTLEIIPDDKRITNTGL